MGHGVSDFDESPEPENPTVSELREEAKRQEQQAKDAEQQAKDAEQQAKDSEQRRVEAEQRAMEEERQRVESERQKADLAQKLDMAEKGIEPSYEPTTEDIEDAKRKINYQPDKLHLAIAGFAGCGKSSLVNAFRRITDRNQNAARTGTSETTKEIGRYPDPDPDLPFSRFIWYDLPGAGTQDVSLREYAKTQALYVFDVVILVVGSRFLESDVTLLKHCKEFKVPTFIVRSRADEQIENIKMQRNQEQDFEDDEYSTDHDWMAARTPEMEFFEDTNASIQTGLHKAGLPPQRVYIVSRSAVHYISAYIRQRTFQRRPQLFEAELLVRAVLVETYKRRYPIGSEEVRRQLDEQLNPAEPAPPYSTHGGSGSSRAMLS